jgi:hypothetical protein
VCVCVCVRKREREEEEEEKERGIKVRYLRRWLISIFRISFVVDKKSRETEIERERK